MHKTLIAAALLGAVALTGCTDTTAAPADTVTVTEAPEPEYTPEPEPDAEPAVSDDEIGAITFATLLKSEYPGDFGLVPDDMLADLGRSICTAYDGGSDVFDLAMVAMNEGYSAEASAYMVGAAGPSFCDYNTADMQAEFNNLG
jgi:hypothetical protein